MKKVGFIIGQMNSGGAERVISVISDKFIKKGYDVTLIIFRKSNIDYNINPKIDIVELTNIKSKVKRFILTPVILSSTMKKYNCDVYISFCILENITSCIANLFAKKRLIISERNAPNHEKIPIIFKVLRKLLYSTADGYVFQTDEAKKCYSGRIQDKSTVIPNPLKEDLINAYRGKRKNKIVAVGRLCEQKNYKLMIDAFYEFCKYIKGYKLCIYGRGPLENDIRENIEQLGLKENVELKGFVKNVHEEIKDSSFFIMTSDYEGMPNALMEAMAIGLPVISTDCPAGGPSKLISNNRNGILVGVGNKDELVKSMIKLANQKEYAEQLGNNAISIRDLYDVEKIVNEWEIYLKNIIDKKEM